MGSSELPEGHAEYIVVVDLSTQAGRAVASVLDGLETSQGVTGFAYKRRRSEFVTNDDLRAFLRTSRGSRMQDIEADASIIWAIVAGHRLTGNFGTSPEIWWRLTCRTYCGMSNCGKPRWGDNTCECSKFYFDNRTRWRPGHPWKVSIESLIEHSGIYAVSEELVDAVGPMRVAELRAWIRSLEMGRREP